MPNSYTYSLRFTLQATGENAGTWGTILNAQTLALIDQAVAGISVVNVSGTTVLSSNNGASDQARVPFIQAYGSGGTIQVPAVNKLYNVWNTCSGTISISAGGTATNIPSGATALVAVLSDGTCVNMSPADFAGRRLTSVGYAVNDTDGASKKFVTDALSQTIATGLPPQGGHAAQFLGSDGTTATWTDPLPEQSSAYGKVLRSNGVSRTGAYWDTLPFSSGRAVTTNYAVLPSDNGKGILALSGVGYVVLVKLSDYGGSFGCIVTNESGAPFFLNTQSPDVFATGGNSIVMLPKESRLIYSDGFNTWITTILQPYDMTLTGSQTLTVGPGYTRHVGLLWAGGAGGARQSSSVGGGGGGACVPFDVPAGSFGLSQVVTIGAGGAGGATDGAGGGQGGTSSIGGLVVAYGGAGGQVGGSGGGGGTGPGVGGSGGGGGPAFRGGSAGGDVTLRDASYGGGASSNTAGNPGGSSFYGGGGGGGYANTAIVAPGASIFGGQGGGGNGSGPGVAGATPGGGGGGSTSASGGSGARGECRIRGVV